MPAIKLDNENIGGHLTPLQTTTAIIKSSDGHVRQQETVKKFIEQYSESSVMVFTDGSVCNGPVGSGACAAVVLPHCANEEIFTMTGAVGTRLTRVNSLFCEVTG